VRQGRYTKGQPDRTGEFAVSIPLDKADGTINRICGGQSGFNIDKVIKQGLSWRMREPSIRPVCANIR
jgi:hypothetical protein